MSRGMSRRYECDLVGVVVCLRCPLHPLLVWSGSMWPPLVHEIEWFCGSFGPLICSFNFRQGRALIRRMVFFTDQTHFYRVQWTFVPRMLSSAPKTKDGQSPLCFLLFSFDMHGKHLPHLTLGIFEKIFKFTSKG